MAVKMTIQGLLIYITMGAYLVALVLTTTFVSYRQNAGNIVSAMIAGTIFNLANLLLVAGIVLGIGVLGTIVSILRTGRQTLGPPGVGPQAGRTSCLEAFEDLDRVGRVRRRLLAACRDLALDGGLIRFVRRSAETGIVTPGAELRARFLQPRHPLAYGYGESTTVFRANLPIYDLPRRWVRMAYCTSCLDGPIDTSSVVMEWGGVPVIAEDGGDPTRPPIVVSGGGRREDDLAGSPAILAVPRGEGMIVAYNFNPMHRNLNHSDHRLLWNGILNWRHLRPAR